MNESQTSGRLARGLLRLLSNRRSRWILLVLAAAAFVRYREAAETPLGPPVGPASTSTSVADAPKSDLPEAASPPDASWSTDVLESTRSPALEEGEEYAAARWLEHGRGEFQSPAGLVYAPGSQHGHRLKHVLAHSRDDPGRPGPHGVFDPQLPDAVVAVVDEAYQLALRGDPRARLRRDGDRAVWTVDMGRRVGYVGGQVGRRRGHPAARHLRLVLEEDRVITAYPIIP